VSWRASATAVDGSGAASTGNAAPVGVTPPELPATPPSASGTSRIELWGGQGFQTYLSCFNCNRFDPESLANTFGLYGSRFSATSIFNHFSNFGSRFAINPPRLVDVGAGPLIGALTLNRFAQLAITEPAVVAWLENTVCEVE
jgi:hypothetical protein